MQFVFLASSNKGHSCEHLGAIEIEIIHDRISKDKRVKKGKPYFGWTDEGRHIVAKYASQNWTAATVRHYQSKYTGLNESTVQGFKSRVEKELEIATKKK